MTWLAWRQARAQTALALAALAVVVAVLSATHGHVASAADLGALTPPYRNLRLLGTALIGLPAVLGAFWGAPLVAREIEAGTHRLAWTQGTSRTRWFVIRLAVVVAAAAVVTGVFSAVLTWWSGPFDRDGGRIGTADFGQRGIAPVAYAVFAVALGALLGIVVRRTLPAMAATLAVFFALRFAFQGLVRTHLAPVETVTRPSALFAAPEGAPPAGWVLDGHTIDGAGHRTRADLVDRSLVDSCGLTRDSPATAFAQCTRRLGIRDVLHVHPEDQFWHLQVLESLAFVGLAALLAVVALGLLRRTSD